MDKCLERLTEFTMNRNYEELSPLVVHEIKRRVIDTLGCAVGGFDATPSVIARSVARRVASDTPSRLIGTLENSSPELAAFANGVMIRYLDCNDATGSGGGHPSDVLAATFAVADSRGSDGKSVIAAATVAYELFLGFFEAVRIRNSGWDHVVYGALASSGSAGKLLDLGHEAMAHALSLAVVPNFALEVTRRGELSMWKGCAAGNAARNGVFAAMLAAEGLTAPMEPFEGENGVWNAVGEFSWPDSSIRKGLVRPVDTHIKLYPAEYHGQAPIEAALSIRPQIDIDEIDEIIVRTYWFAWSEIGSEPAKWNPHSRETADHSIPFLVCAALLHGKLTPASFAQEHIQDLKIRQLMQKVSVVHDTNLDKLQPIKNPCRMEVVLKSGRRVAADIDYPKGHFKNPATDSELEEKFRGMCQDRLSERQIADILAMCWQLEELDDFRKLISAFLFQAKPKS